MEANVMIPAQVAVETDSLGRKFIRLRLTGFWRSKSTPVVYDVTNPIEVFIPANTAQDLSDILRTAVSTIPPEQRLNLNDALNSPVSQ